MHQDIENIKSTLERVIKKNLPEKKEHDWSKDEHTKTCKDGCTYCCNADGMITGFNQALSQINTSLIADEVRKVVVEKINEIEKSYLGSGEFLSEIGNGAKCVIEDIKSALSNISPNKENKNK